MPSLRKRVSSYFRQLSFHNEPRYRKNNVNENAFVTKYLQGHISLTEGPPIIYGKNPTDLPNYELGKYESGPDTEIGCYSGPNGGLTTVKRTEKHLSIPDDDIDFIDNPEEETVPPPMPKKSPIRVTGQPIDNTTMVIKVAGHEYCVTNKPKRHSKSFSLGSISDFDKEIEKMNIDKELNCDSKMDENSNERSTKCKENQRECDSNGLTSGAKNKEIMSKIGRTRQYQSLETNSNNVKVIKNNQKELTNPRSVSECEANSDRNSNSVHNNSKNPSVNFKNSTETKHHERSAHSTKSHTISSSSKDKLSGSNTKPIKNYALSKSKSDGAPFHNKKIGKLIQVQRPKSHRGDDPTEYINHTSEVSDDALPPEWTKKSEYFFGVSDSLYDKHPVGGYRNGNPIADCFGLIARNDSAVLAVADGVNWGEKASIAAKSAIHASLYYLNKTIFNDTKPFEQLTIKTDDASLGSDTINPNENMNLISNTREVFVCLLRAFNCAHDLILENKGMLTTLTVAVILPLKQRPPPTTENDGRISNQEPRYVCCVCNVGDTLAYIYSQKYGVRELTKGSHDVNSNRDMRDALGALGPVDGINPDLSNLTLSITTLQKGDIIMIASDGLTDNFDPNVCRFTVNSYIDPPKTRSRKTHGNIPTTSHKSSHSSNSQSVSQSNQQVSAAQSSNVTSHSHRVEESSQKPPIKPPRRSKNPGSISSASNSERSSPSVEKELKSDHSQQQNISTHQPPQTSNKLPLNQTQHEADNTKTKNQPEPQYENPLVAQFMRENSLEDPHTTKIEARKPPPVIENKASSLRKQASNQSRTDSARKLTPPSKNAPKTLDTNRTKQETVGYKFLKSKTSLDLRSSHPNKIPILRNGDGIPYVTPIQRYELQLLLMEDILRNGISGQDSPITTARKLCESLLSFTLSITAAKRRTLEDRDLYYDHRDGIYHEVSSQERKIRRKKGLEKVQSLPGKLDHVTVVAYNVGNFAF